MMKHGFATAIILAVLFACVPCMAASSSENRPSGVLVDLVPQEEGSLICSEHPYLSWIVPMRGKSGMQKAYRVVCKSGSRLVWDSGKVVSSNSTAVPLGGPALVAGTEYTLKVKLWLDSGATKWSKPFTFVANPSEEFSPSYRRLVKTEQEPVRTWWEDGKACADFGKAAFGQLSFTADVPEAVTATVVLSEAGQNIPGSSIRYAEYQVELQPGQREYSVELRPDPRNTMKARANEGGNLPVYMPDYIGEVYPFRYCSVTVPEGTEVSFRRAAVNYPFDDNASEFTCSDTTLNAVWDLCKYSIKATSFAGIYVDGDRERIAYEADALINQLGHYCVDREFSMARRSTDYLIDNPTWPTEWCLQTLILVWQDYVYTGDDRLIRKHYDVLKAKTLMALKDDSGLISTRTGLLTPQVQQSVHFRGRTIRDIVDWPQSGGPCTEKQNPGEADGFVMTAHNTVVNAFHYRAVCLLAEMAKVLDQDADAAELESYCSEFKQTFNSKLLGPEGLYRDGIETDHVSQHGNMFPYVFGLAPEENAEAIVEFIKSRRMACSVYGAQFLLDALYAAGEGDYAFSLMASTAQRSWYNMIRVGSTVTLEAWDRAYKPNLDWNHAWGAAPANTIARGLLGVEPLEPGFARFRIRPQVGPLESLSAAVPTIRGTVKISYDKGAYEIVVPANTVAEFCKEDGSTVTLTPGKHIIKTK